MSASRVPALGEANYSDTSTEEEPWSFDKHCLQLLPTQGEVATPGTVSEPVPVIGMPLYCFTTELIFQTHFFLTALCQSVRFLFGLALAAYTVLLMQSLTCLNGTPLFVKRNAVHCTGACRSNDSKQAKCSEDMGTPFHQTQAILHPKRVAIFAGEQLSESLPELQQHTHYFALGQSRRSLRDRQAS